MTLIWRPGFQFDVDASTYIEAVEVADGQALETGVRYAINDFVIGCKQDGIWNAIKASCILAGARTLAGALVPLVGTAPTKYGTEGGWSYNRETGLQGNGTDNYLDSNRNNNTDPAGSRHLSAYIGSAGSSSRPIIASSISSGGSYIVVSGAGFFQTACNGNFTNTGITNRTGFVGVKRSVNTSIDFRSSGISVNALVSAQLTPISSSIRVFADDDTDGNARISFYSIGESLDLAALDGRVTDLMTAIGAAIP